MRERRMEGWTDGWKEEGKGGMKRGIDGGKERSRQKEREEGRGVRYLLRLPIYVQHLVADCWRGGGGPVTECSVHNATGLTFKVVDIQSVHELSPPGLAPRVSGTLQVVLGQLPCQVDEGHSNGLGLPLQTQCRAKTVCVRVWKEGEEGDLSH